MPFAATCMQLEIIILSEVSQKEKDTSYNIVYRWNLNQGTNKPIYKTETDSQAQRTDMWLPRGRWLGEEDGVGVWGWQTQTIIE